LCEPAHNSEASRSVLLGILIPSSPAYRFALCLAKKGKQSNWLKATTEGRCRAPPQPAGARPPAFLHREGTTTATAFSTVGTRPPALRNPTPSPPEPDLRQVRASEPSVPSPPLCCPLPPSAGHPWSSLRRRTSRSVSRPSSSLRRARLNLPPSRLQLPPPAAPKPEKKVAPPPRAPSASRSLSSLRRPRL
jgi:hypothetical protein